MLRSYQQDIFSRVAETWRTFRGVMVQMPTGTGKTHLLASIVHDELSGKPSARVWIVAHRRELVEQIEETVARYGIRKEDKSVRVMSIQWLARHWIDIKEKPDLIVIDEAHHALARTYKELWARYPEARTLGMTATPCRLSCAGFADLFGTLVTSQGVLDFIREGWLSAFDYVSVRSESEEQRLVDGLKKHGADGDYQVKEMDAALNRRPSIGRLYAGLAQYAGGRKGIVYAISINHARHIAGYYNERGTHSAVIDSKTPAAERKRLVEDFRSGRLQVLVNVDVFSEGFDCPDVEFVQLARPTLSLAKYLQQVGRGLRRSEGKRPCVILDHVGLYRLFGLPTRERDWRAMFEGRLAGKGRIRATKGMRLSAPNVDETPEDDSLEVVVTHDKLLAPGSVLESTGAESPQVLRPFRDKMSDLYGLRRGETVTAKAAYICVYNIKDGLAAVRFDERNAGVVDEHGNAIRRIAHRYGLRLLGNGLVAMRDKNGRDARYMDLCNGKMYPERPFVVRFGKAELLRAGDRWHSRTKIPYTCRLYPDRHNCIWMGFYLKIYDCLSSGSASLCVLEDDNEEVYRLHASFADGSILISDHKGRWYHVLQDRKERLSDNRSHFLIPRLREEAERRAVLQQQETAEKETRERAGRLERLRSAVPFRSGTKWGLRLGERVIVPPLYCRVCIPVGVYCAFEGNPRQWGVLALDGRIEVEPRYTDVHISSDGTVRLTVIPGKVKTVRLDQ